ncbi:MAG TPA: hypothetical protein DEV81_18715 [Cyanobacteria bacterium UBA11049]|nr:hypothetical protein [Cyanobacteria bacterium UBA11049]
MKQPVLHASLSLLPGESLTDEQFREACETWMDKMGFDLTKNQYLIVRHLDTDHSHAHMAINRIDMVSGLVVVDSFERYRSQEIIRHLEQTYGLEPVAPSWQTFKNKEHDLEQNPKLSHQQKLTQSIEQAAIGSPTMPEFFQRLADHQIRAEVGFTRNGKPKGITYQTADREKVAGNALGKAYSFPGLQKYLQVNYDPARDNQKLVEIVQNARQQHQEIQQARETAPHFLELQTPQPQMETVSEQPLPEQKTQSVWTPQYGIPTVQDLIKAIPEHPKELLLERADNANRQLEQAQAAYQQWASLARAVYQVESPQDVDLRIAFLMLEQRQTSNSITQVLLQSPAVQELLKRDRSYAHSYSQYCQSKASNNQATWLKQLDQYRSSVEAERQIFEQQRIATERQRQDLLERQHNLDLLGQWQTAAIALGQPADYVERIREVTADYQRGLPLSENIVEARTEDLATYQQLLQAQRRQQSRGRGFSQ